MLTGLIPAALLGTTVIIEVVVVSIAVAVAVLAVTNPLNLQSMSHKISRRSIYITIPI